MKNLTFKAAALNDSRPTVDRRSTDGQSQRRYSLTPITKRWRALMMVVFLFTLSIGQMWAQTSWVRLDSIDFTNTTDFPAATYLSSTADVKTTVNGVFFWAKKGTKALKVNDGVNGVDFGGQNVGSNGQHGVAIPVTGVNGSLKVIVYHDYNNTSANHKVGISHAEGNDPSVTQTFDQSPSNSGTKNKNEFIFTKTSLTGTDYIVWVGESSSSYTHFKKVAIYTEAPSTSAPAITAPTTDQSATYTVGDVITPLSVTATGTPAPTYQWYYNSSASTEGATSLGSGAQTASYTPSNAAVSDLYFYCVATNSEGSAQSPYFHVEVNAAVATAPSFTSPASEPAVAEYSVGDAISALEVVAAGYPAPTLQWYSNSSKSTEGATLITGAESASYTPSNAAVSDLYFYCVATNASGTAQSEYFHVTVAAVSYCAELVPATSGEAIAVGDIIDLQTGSNGGTMTATNLGSGNLAYHANGLGFNSKSGPTVKVVLNHNMQVGTKLWIKLMAAGADTRGLTLKTKTGTTISAFTCWVKDVNGATNGDVETFTYTVVAGDGLEGTNEFQLVRNNSVWLQSLKVSNCGAELLDLDYAITPAHDPAYATVTLSKSLVAAGGTATATYSAIDAAYDFDEWVVSGATIDDAKANPVTITMGSTAATITLKLKAASVKHTVTYYDGATELGTEQVEEGSNPTGAGLAPKKHGYTFGGWSLTNGGDAIASYASVTVDADKELFVVWTPVVCPTSGVVFSIVADPSKAPDSDYQIAGNTRADLATYATITRGAAVFGNADGNQRITINSSTGAISLTSSNMRGYVKATMDCDLQEGDIIRITDNTNKFRVAFDSTATDKVDVSSGNHDVVIDAAHKDKYEFFIYRNGNDVTFSTIQVIRPYTVSFNMNGKTATAIDAQKVADGGKVTKPADPTTTNYTFEGWYKEAACTNAWDFTNDVVNTDVELFANWTAWPTMTLNRGAATSGDDVVTSVEPGSVVTVPACPFSYTDYNFNGWAYSPAVTMVDETHFTMPSENLTLTAQWVDANNVAQIGSTKYATFAEAAAAVADGETIQLLQDCDYDATWTITGMAVTLDLNGKNLTNATGDDAVAIKTGGKLTIMDGTATIDPTINGSNEVTYAAGKFTSGGWLINVYTGAEFVMNSGWLLAQEAAVYVEKTAIATVNNGVLEALDNAVIMGHGKAERAGYTINVHGGILLGHIQSAGYASMVIYHPNIGTLNIDGGKLISTNGPAVVIRGGESNITGGEIIAQGSGEGKCGDASQNLGAVGIVTDFKSAYPGVANTDVAISGDVEVTGEAGAVEAIYAAAEPTAAEEEAIAVSGGTFSSPVAEALCADDYYPATKPSGKYGVTYAAESIDFEAFIDENGTGDDAKTLLASQLAAKHYELSEALNTDHLDAPAGKPQDKGLKVKKTGLEIYFSVEPEKVLEIKTGNISGASIAINGGAAEDLTSTSIATHTYYNDNAQAVVLTMTKAGDKYNIFQSINIRNPYQVTLDATTNGGEAVAPMYGKMSVILPSATKGTDHFIGWYDAAENGTLVGLADAEYTPTADVTLYAHFAAQSNDGRLSDLQVDGTTVDGFDMDVHIYNLTVPYGTAVSALPKITLATAYDSYAQGVSIYPTDGPEWRADVDGGCYVQQANVTAEDGSVVYNQVRTKILPKDMACLVWADVPSANTLTYNATKSLMAEDAVTLAINNVSGTDGPAGVKFQKKGYIKIEMNEGTFQAGDVVALDVTGAAGSTMHVFKVQTPSSEADVIGTGEGTTTPVGINKVAITEDAAALYLARPNDGTYNGWNPHVDYVAVYRPVPNPLVETITFNGAVATVDNDLKTITVEVPATTNLATMPVMASFLSNDPSQTNGAVTGSWAEGDNEYIVTDKDNDQTVYAVTITKAVPSSDATLSALSYGTPATAIALADDVYEYDVELPYGTSAVPALAATAHHAGATIESIDDATAFVDRKATSTVTVKAEDDATVQVYTVNFTVDRYETTVLWDGSTMDELSDITALNIATADISVEGKTASFEGKNYTKALNFGGNTKNTRYFGIEIPAGKVAKVSVVYRSRGNSARSIIIGTAIASAIDESAIVYATKENDTELLYKLTADIFAAGTIYINTTNGYQVFEISLQLADGFARSSMLGAGVLGTVCVPNNVAIEDIQGVTVYELMGRDYNNYGKLAFDEIISGELEAGAPYVFMANGNHMALLYGETHVDNPVDKGNGMYGTFTDQTLTELDDVYYFAQRALWSCDGLTELSLPANRAYVKLSEIGEVSSPTPNPARRRITMAVNGEKVATGIDNLEASEKPLKLMIDGQMYILRGEKLFDATGRLVK